MSGYWVMTWLVPGGAGPEEWATAAAMTFAYGSGWALVSGSPEPLPLAPPHPAVVLGRPSTGAVGQLNLSLGGAAC